MSHESMPPTRFVLGIAALGVLAVVLISVAATRAYYKVSPVPVMSTDSAPRATQSQIQLDGAIPVEVASNAVQSNWKDSYTSAIERCWRGVTYVIFFTGHDSRANVGGSAVIMPDGKPLPCDQ